MELSFCRGIQYAYDKRNCTSDCYDKRSWRNVEIRNFRDGSNGSSLRRELHCSNVDGSQYKYSLLHVSITRAE